MNDLTETTDDPRFGIGGNNPPLPQLLSESSDFADDVNEWLRDGPHGILPKRVREIIDEAAPLIAAKEIIDDATKERASSLIKRARDLWKELRSHHDKEALPYMRGKDAIDQYFFGLMDRLGRRDKKARAGIGDELGAMLTAYDVRKEAEERARRKAEADRLAAEQRKREEEAARLREEEEQARLAAERARKPETREDKAAVADAAMIDRAKAEADAKVAADAAERAYVESLAKPADIMRARQDDGVLTTMATESYAEIENEALLDRDKLWPFISLDAKEKALRAWARTTGHTVDMAGAKVGKRPKSVVR